MKAITLWQPWATLVALGLKTIETRSWKTDYRGPLAIHAAARAPVWTENREITDVLARAGYENGYPQFNDDGSPKVVKRLPRGVVIATCVLDGVMRAEDFVASMKEEGKLAYLHEQAAFGDLGENRFAWILRDVKPLNEPRAARGGQGLWNWDGAFESGEVAAYAREQAARQSVREEGLR